MKKIFSLAGKVVRQSKNLAGILRHNTAFPTRHVGAKQNPDGSGVLHVIWSNGDWTTVKFNCFSLMQDWIKARRHWKHLKTR